MDLLSQSYQRRGDQTSETSSTTSSYSKGSGTALGSLPRSVSSNSGGFSLGGDAPPPLPRTKPPSPSKKSSLKKGILKGSCKL